MHPRAGLALSLLAACGIHAGILLVPRADFLSAPIPVVEIDLTEALPAPLAAAPEPQVAPRRAETAASVPPVTAPVTAPVPAPAPAPSPQAPVLSSAPLGEADASSVAAASEAAAPAVVPSTAPASTASSSYAAAAPVGSPALGPTSGPSASSRSPLIPPQPRASILPVYPRGARTSGLQGVVKVSALVDPSGAVTSAEVLISSGSALLDRAALDAVRHAAFLPATQDGLPVACRAIVPIRFQLSRAP